MPNIYLPSNRAPHPKEQKFQVHQPTATHHVPVSCRDYECEQYIGGFLLVLPIASEDIQKMRLWLKVGFPDGMRRSAVETLKDGGLVEFRFEPGQPCLRASQHRWIGRPPIFTHDKGEMRRSMRFDDWTDLYNNEGYLIKRARERG